MLFVCFCSINGGPGPVNEIVYGSCCSRSHLNRALLLPPLNLTNGYLEINNTVISHRFLLSHVCALVPNHYSA